MGRQNMVLTGARKRIRIKPEQGAALIVTARAQLRGSMVSMVCYVSSPASSASETFRAVMIHCNG